MSGSTIPYHLRPHKAVDRRIFIDLLSRVERWKPVVDYVYLSMGAYPLEDHKLIHRILGVTRQIAFDMKAAVVARQRFNRPLDTCRCINKTSAEIVDDFDAILEECGFRDPAGVIVWLDYTDPKKIGEQVREFEALIRKLRVGDIVRVTVNAHPRPAERTASGKPPAVEKTHDKHLADLRALIGEYLPSGSSSQDMTKDRLPLLLAESFGASALKALPTAGSNTFSPLSIVRYADGTQMLSITGVIVERALETLMRESMHLHNWPFESKRWSHIHKLVVPDLTLRERLHLEREVVSKTVDDIVEGLGFNEASGVPISDFIETYKSYYRFYPTLLNTEL